MNGKAFFVASTGQHVGKTTTCLGLISGMKKHFKKVSFIKPVGQQHVKIEKDLHVDKDVLLFKDYFSIEDPVEKMSPVLFPQGFTRDFLDGKVSEQTLSTKICDSFTYLKTHADCIIVEGTGHIGVGSIANLNNARVASLLGVDIFIVASGGLGSSFDAIAINKALCDTYKVKIKGVILNRVLKEKKEMILSYMQKALERWEIPILGCIPFDPFLSNPSMKDFTMLFRAKLLSGEEHRMRHFRHFRLVATSLENYEKLILPSQLIITPATREEIILATIHEHWKRKKENPKFDLEAGLILTGSTKPTPTIIQKLKEAHIPMLYAPLTSYEAMQKITSHTAKIQHEDEEKIQEAIEVVESHIDFPKLCSLL